ncbi:MAG: glycerophosphodiester phosphodiesterase family protein [Gammaproteobacteria bacterium]|nr:glycerophosphodiester phosphodiesterase family protein [Gammaproteobacteria bacterium]
MANPRVNISAFSGTLFGSSQGLAARFVAHRGANNESPGNTLPHFPENTLHSLREAYAKGAIYVECDVHKTKDNKIIVIHDETLFRTARFNPDIAKTLTKEDFLNIRNKNVSELSFVNEVSQVDVGSYASYLSDKFKGTKVSLLEDFLLELKNHSERKLIIEVKMGDMSIVDELQKLIKHYAAQYEIKDEQLLFISFDFDLLKSLKMFLSNYKHLFLTIATPSDTNSSDDAYHLIKTKNDLDKMIQMVLKANLDGLDVEYDSDLIDEDFMKRIRDHNLTSAVWTYPKDDRLAMAIQMLTAGADLINTNQPEFIFENLHRPS